MSKKVLIVEDNDSSMKLFSSVLKCGGYQPIEARSGIEAVTLAKQERPHLILLNIRISLVNRFETLKLLSDEPATKNIPSIAITTNPIDGKREEIAKLGFADCIAKPINVKDFMDVIEKRDLRKCCSNRCRGRLCRTWKLPRKREIEERIAAYDRGDLQAFSAENVFAEARRNTR